MSQLESTHGNVPFVLAPTANISQEAEIGFGTIIWDQTQVREGAVLGESCNIGRGVYIDAGVKVGRRCKIQNGAQLFSPALIEDGAFIGPNVILTNDQYPRSVDDSGELKDASMWESVGVVVREGASLGAGAICVAPVEIGKWAVVGAGSVVTSNVRNFELVRGVPARPAGWVGHAGIPLEHKDGTLVCPKTLREYVEVAGELQEKSSD